MIYIVKIFFQIRLYFATIYDKINKINVNLQEKGSEIDEMSKMWCQLA